MFDSRNFDITAFPEDVLDNASYYGRIFARSGGLSDAVAEGLKERGLSESFEFRLVKCSGIEECRTALLKAQRGKLEGNFIEGMACAGGCINGAGCLTHGEKNKAEVDEYGRKALEKKITDAVSVNGLVKKIPAGDKNDLASAAKIREQGTVFFKRQPFFFVVSRTCGLIRWVSGLSEADFKDLHDVSRPLPADFSDKLPAVA